MNFKNSTKVALADTDSNSIITSDNTKQLWRAVIAQAVADCNIPPSIYRRLTNKEAYFQAVRLRARNWFLHNSDHFQLVCDLAQIPSNFVRERACCTLQIQSGQAKDKQKI